MLDLGFVTKNKNTILYFLSMLRELKVFFPYQVKHFMKEVNSKHNIP